jgi:hypothetical protein
MKTLSILSLLVLSSVTAFASQTPDPKAPKVPGEHAAMAGEKPAAARVFFKNLKNGQTIPQDYLVKFGAEGIAVKPSGAIVSGTGHHHLIIDGDAIPAGKVVPNDATHLHFGKGQTEAKVHLKPGKHKLVLQFANGAHISYGPDLAATVDVIVK